MSSPTSRSRPYIAQCGGKKAFRRSANWSRTTRPATGPTRRRVTTGMTGCATNGRHGTTTTSRQRSTAYRLGSCGSTSKPRTSHSRREVLMPYTTDDEIFFLRKIAADRDVSRLERMRAAYEARIWLGAGMKVDRDRVLAEFDLIIAAKRAVAAGTVRAPE